MKGRLAMISIKPRRGRTTNRPGQQKPSKPTIKIANITFTSLILFLLDCEVSIAKEKTDKTDFLTRSGNRISVLVLQQI